MDPRSGLRLELMFKWFRSKHGRTIFLAILATAVFVVAAIKSFDVEPMLLLSLFAICIVGVLIIIVAALLVSLLPVLYRKYISKNAKANSENIPENNEH